ncbi:MAG: radical SAM protein, partial [Parcubacteria group bacterium]
MASNFDPSVISTGLAFMPAWLPFAPPLGITAVAAYLKKSEINVSVFDYNGKIWKQHQDFGHYWKMDYGGSWSHVKSYRERIHPVIVQSLVSAAHEMINSGVKSLGFSVYSSNYLPTRFTIKLIRLLRPDIKIYVGGASIDKKLAEQDLKEHLIDAAIFGEGEDSCLRLLKYWEGQISIDELKSTLIYNDQGELFTAERNNLVKLNSLPIPDYSYVNFEHYYGRTLPLEFGRGCVANCSFCSETNYWVSFRVKSIDQIIAEMKNHIEKYQINEFRVVDSLMNGNYKFLEQLIDRIIDEKLNVKWYGFCRIDKRLTPELLAKMRKAGCTSIAFGLESGSQKILNLMNKRVQIYDSYEVVTAAHNAGINVCAEILMGF